MPTARHLWTTPRREPTSLNKARGPGRVAGFTIVELLIVVVVIAILAAITIVAYNGVTRKAQETAVLQSVSQSKKQLELYKINHGAYPLTGDVASAGITGGQTSYQYTSVDGSSFCLTGTSGVISYYVDAAAQATPAAGACSGHTPGGTATITNYYLDPRPGGTSLVSWWAGNTGNVAAGSYVNNATWSVSGRAVRIAYSAVTNNYGGPIVSLRTSYAPYLNQTYTVVASIRSIAGSATIGWMTIDRDGSVGTVNVLASGGTTGATPMTNGTTYKVYATFNADNTALNANLRYYVLLGNKSNDTTVEVADVDLYPGAYDASRTWHSGGSYGWSWSGAENSSISSGPAIP